MHFPRHQLDPGSFPQDSVSISSLGTSGQGIRTPPLDSGNDAVPRPQKIQDLVQAVTRLAGQESSGLTSAESHAELLERLDELKLTVETGPESVLRMIYQPPQNAALRTVIEIGIFQVLVEANPGQGMKAGMGADELAAKTGADRALIVRLMRVMTSLGFCNTVAPERYTANQKTSTLTGPIGQGGVRCIYDLTLPTLSSLPNYLHNHNYTNPTDYNASPMQWAVGKSQFEWLAARPEHQRLFNGYMASRREGKRNWFDVYPIAERLIQSLSASQDTSHQQAFLVDVGGNRGHDLKRFVDLYKQKNDVSIPGRLILQDLPLVVENAIEIEGVEPMAYSFFDPQPVKGARTYFFHAILHDWPDHICHQILTNTRSAMDPAHSRIIIVDHVLPDSKAPLIQASMDIQMMGIGAGMERSAAQWRELLGNAGLEIRGIWKGDPGMEGVIEAGVKTE